MLQDDFSKTVLVTPKKPEKVKWYMGDVFFYIIVPTIFEGHGVTSKFAIKFSTKL